MKTCWTLPNHGHRRPERREAAAASRSVMSTATASKSADHQQVEGASASSSSGIMSVGREGSKDLRAIFEHFDENKDGQISKEEMSGWLERLGLAVAGAELAEMIEAVDANKDGFVNYEEFVGLYESLVQAGREHEGGVGDEDEDAELRQAFEVFDQDGDGLITALELQSVLQSMGVSHGRSLADCAAMIHRVDSDGNGQVDFHEFKLMMSSSGFG